MKNHAFSCIRFLFWNSTRQKTVWQILKLRKWINLIVRNHMPLVSWKNKSTGWNHKLGNELTQWMKEMHNWKWLVRRNIETWYVAYRWECYRYCQTNVQSTPRVQTKFSWQHQLTEVGHSELQKDIDWTCINNTFVLHSRIIQIQYGWYVDE